MSLRRHRLVRMQVTVMDIRIVRMLVRQDRVAMRMRMRFIAAPLEGVRVPMMLVVTMTMRMLERLVGMLVLVPLANVQPHA